MNLTDKLIDKRLQWLFDRMEEARRYYYETDHQTRQEWERDVKAYNAAVWAYNESARRYNRSAPTVRAFTKRVYRIMWTTPLPSDR